MADKKEYTLVINGIDKDIKDVTTLDNALSKLDKTIGAVNSTMAGSAKVAKDRKAAVTEEQKEEQKLAAAIDKVVQARTDANKALIEANIAAREAQREVTREIQIRQAAEGSIKQLGMQLTDLRNQYDNLSRAEREDLEIGGRLLNQIQALDAEYKGLKESTGRFQDSVGNYEKALTGLGKLSGGIEGVTKSTMGLAQGLVVTNGLMSLFGEQSEEDAKRAQDLQKVIALLSLAQQINTNILKEGIVQGKLSAITNSIQTVQIKAKTAAETASTKGTVAATVAQKIFNVVASANPYVLLALALVAVGAALYTFTTNAENAAQTQKKLNEIESAHLDILDEEERKIVEVSAERVKEMQRQIKLLEIQGGKQEEIRKLEDDIAKERRRNNASRRGFSSDELKDLEANKTKLDEYRRLLLKLKDAQAMGANKMEVDFDLNGNAKKANVKEAIETIQGKIDNLGRKVQVGVSINTEGQELEDEEKIRRARRQKEDEDTARKTADTELAVFRAAQDARLKLIQNTDEQARKTLIIAYDRQIEDIKLRLERETGLTKNARKALNETIVNLERQKAQDLDKLQKEQADRALLLTREVEDSRRETILGNYEKQEAEIKAGYDRQIEDYRKRLAQDKTLTEEQQTQITELILNAQVARANALNNLTADQLRERSDLELSAIESTLREAQNLTEDFTARDKGGLQLIDIKATRKNLEDANGILSQYVESLNNYQETLKKSHEQTLLTLEEGTPEYEAEMQRYAQANEDVAQRIKTAQKGIEENTKQSGSVVVDYLKDLFDKIGKYAETAAMAVTSVTDTFSMAIQVQLDSLAEDLEVLDEKYEEAKKRREDAVESVKEIEKEMQEATGGTAEALREQLQDSMHARAEAEREEQRLAKEKEKREAEIAKKEKQLKRAELVSNIVQGISNTAKAVVNALGFGPPPVAITLAAIMGALGAVQVGIMVKQLSKLEDGGLIKGPSHANGGARIHGTNIEVEGGEYVTNKVTTSKNLGLLRFINSQRQELRREDMDKYFSGQSPQALEFPFSRVFADGGQLPIIQNNTEVIDYDRLAETMSSITVESTVAVTDIMDVEKEVVTVQDVSDF